LAQPLGPSKIDKKNQLLTKACEGEGGISIAV